MHPVTLLWGPTAGMGTTRQGPLKTGSMHNYLLLDRPTAQKYMNARILVMPCAALLHGVPVVQLSLHKPWAGRGVGRKPQRVKSTVSSCTTSQLSLHCEVPLVSRTAHG